MRGRKTRKMVPLPTTLSTAICPPDCVTMPYAVDKPRPVPLPATLVVKNGSKMRARVAASMPEPVSLTDSTTQRPAGTPRRCDSAASTTSTFSVAMASAPPEGMASRALMTRLTTTCSSWPASARTLPRRSASVVRSSTCSPMSRRNITVRLATSELRSIVRGCSTCLREKANSCVVSAAARSAARWI